MADRIESGKHDFDAIYRVEGRRLWRALYAASGGRREIADDALAEAFARGLARAPSISRPLPWLYRTALREVFRELKQERRSAALDPASTNPETGEEELDLLRELARLPAKQRAAIVLHYQCDMSVQEIAEALGNSSGAVKVHLYRGRQRLRESLEWEG